MHFLRGQYVPGCAWLLKSLDYGVVEFYLSRRWDCRLRWGARTMKPCRRWGSCHLGKWHPVKLVIINLVTKNYL